MSPHQIIAVAGRLLSVWMAVHLPAQLWAVFSVAGSSGTEATAVRVTSALVLLVNVVVVILLWFFPHTIARKLLTTSATQSPPPASADTWLRMGCALIGLWIVASSFPRLVLDAFIVLSATNSGDTTAVLDSVLYYAAEIAIGVWLILGAKGFRAVFWWASTVGVSKSTE
jgi:hypothetical protein